MINLEERWFNRSGANLPHSVNLSELTSILWRLQLGADEECADVARWNAPSECYLLVSERYISNYQRILDAYGITGDDLIDILEDRVPGWAYKFGFHIPIEVTGIAY